MLAMSMCEAGSFVRRVNGEECTSEWFGESQVHGHACCLRGAVRRKQASRSLILLLPGSPTRVDTRPASCWTSSPLLSMRKASPLRRLREREGRGSRSRTRHSQQVCSPPSGDPPRGPKSGEVYSPVSIGSSPPASSPSSSSPASAPP